MSEILQQHGDLSPVEIEAELDALARRYRAASGLGVNLLNMIGGQVESLLAQMPAGPRAQLGQATERALHLAMQAARQSRRVVPGQSRRVNRLISTAMGAAGGAAGLPGALVELPATTAFLLRTIQDAAATEGFDPNAESVMFVCGYLPRQGHWRGTMAATPPLSPCGSACQVRRSIKSSQPWRRDWPLRWGTNWRRNRCPSLGPLLGRR
jgi:hypothetical protein